MVISFNTALNQAALTGGFVTGTTRDTNQTITGQSVDESTSNSSSFQSSLSIFNNILKGGELPNTFREQTFADNQIALGQSAIDASRAINEQIAIREAQRAADQGFLNDLSKFTFDNVNDLHDKVGNLGSAITDVSAKESSDSFFDGFPTLPSFSQLKTPLIIAGAALAALIIYLE